MGKKSKTDKKADSDQTLKGKTRKKLSRKFYEEELTKLQIELVKLQAWVRHKGLRIVVIFEGRDAAGKGGMIKRITERVSPRVFRTVALPAPSDREKTQFYLQRYANHLPAAGEVVLFDRSWYNRLGVERVMGFCSENEYERFKRNCAGFERALIEDGVILVKYWLTVSDNEQKKRFRRRVEDPLRQWKLSPMDMEARRRWYAYSRARDAMFAATDTDYAPWYIVPSDDKRRARLNCISHLLKRISYKEIAPQAVEFPAPDKAAAYDDLAPLASRKHVPEIY
jgi:polyphosphate kinase 2